ncbi:MAG TPA: hypothetical protein VNJ11_03680 [Bryobacteraceae bacterium]|nr:hypothetical protein [Bryobacteraceae bacterium]
MSEPATKQDLKKLEERIDGRFADFQQRMDARFADFEQRMEARFTEIRELVTDTEIKLLKAFDAFVESNQKRLEGIERDQTNLHERLAILERRVTEVERRLNMPPVA